MNPTATERTPFFPHDNLPLLSGTPTWAPRSLLQEPYASLSPDLLLKYFQTRNSPLYFPLSHGNSEHVKRADNILRNEFAFNNETHQLPDPFDWKVNPSRDVEWLILLHKFYYVRDLALAYEYTREERYTHKWVALVSTWISEVPDGFIDSQVTGRRLQQWLLAYHYFVPTRQSAAITSQFVVELLRSIHAQTRYLCAHLTTAGNHRTIELYAIFLVAVVFPELHDAMWFLDFAKQELLKNMEQDLLEDGVQHELSTDYHHTVLKNYLRVKELAVLNQIELPPRFDELVEKALDFSMYVHKPDGLIPAINDGDSNSYLSLLKKAHSYYPNKYRLYVVSKGKKGTPPPERYKAFPTSGYYVLRGSWVNESYEDGLYMLFDCGPLGFGSHGHYDLLSFEMAAFGHSLIVDPGRYTYSEDSADGINWRRIFKGTAYHNTVVVDGKDQSPYRKGQPIGHEPEPAVKTFATADGFAFIHAQVVSHEYPVVHERILMFALSEYWIITDVLRADEDHQYDLYFHLAPRALSQTTLSKEKRSTCVSSPNLIIAQPTSPEIHTDLLEGFVSSQYGEKQPAPIFRSSKKATGSTCFHTVLYPFHATQPDLTVQQLLVSDQYGRCSPERATALQIAIYSESNTYSDHLFIAHQHSQHMYQFEDIVCSSQMLFLRRDGAGHIINLQAEGLEFLRIGSNQLMNGTRPPRRVSYGAKRVLHDTLDKSEERFTDPVDALTQLLNEP